MKLYWHIHHDVLIETSFYIEARITFIRTHKPNNEIETRLNLLREVRGPLPPAVVTAAHAHELAWFAYVHGPTDYSPVAAEYIQATKVLEQALIDAAEEIERLHAAECPDCPWNGHTIFPKKGGK